MRKLERAFYDRDTIAVARELLGKYLVHASRGVERIGRIVEVEAYLGPHDLAAHSSKGLTERTKVMFGPPGHAYVYLIYGIHQMLNCVCGPGSEANAVLIRAVEPLSDSLPWLHKSARGPGNVCKAFGVQMRHNRGDLCSADSELIILPRRPPKPRTVRGPRIGVDYAGDWAHEPLRFWDARSVHVSR